MTCLCHRIQEAWADLGFLLVGFGLCFAGYVFWQVIEHVSHWLRRKRR